MSRSNNIKYILNSVLFAAAQLFSTGAIVQTFMLYLGISTGQVSVYTSVIQIAQVAVMLLCSFFGDKVKKVRITLAVIMFFLPTIFLSALLASQAAIGNINVKFTVILIGSIVTNLLLGFYNVFCYKLPYFIIDMKNYGRFTAISGIISNVLSVGMTTLISFLTKKFDYLLVMSVAFSCAAVLWLVCSLITLSYQTKEPPAKEEKSKDAAPSFKKLLRLPAFYKLLPGHILRGLATGIFNLIVVIGSFSGALDTEKSVASTVIISVSSVVGYFLYQALKKPLGVQKVLSLSGVLYLLTLPACGLSSNLTVFYVCYFLANAANISLSLGVPVAVYQAVDYEYIGKYTSWRMLLFTLGCAVPGFFMAWLLKKVGAFIPLLVAGAMMCVACFNYALCCKKKN